MLNSWFGFATARLVNHIKHCKTIHTGYLGNQLANVSQENNHALCEIPRLFGHVSYTCFFNPNALKKWHFITPTPGISHLCRQNPVFRPLRRAITRMLEAKKTCWVNCRGIHAILGRSWNSHGITMGQWDDGIMICRGLECIHFWGL